MKSSHRIVFFLVAVQLAAEIVQAGDDLVFRHGFEQPDPNITVRWDGGGDGLSWSDALNWDGNLVPVDGNSVIISDPGAITVTYTTGRTRLSSLQSEESLSLTGGTLELLGSSQIDGTLQQTGGSMSGAGAVTVSGLFTWSAGTQAGSGETLASGGILLSGSGIKDLLSRSLTLGAASTYPGNGLLRFSDGATLTNNVSLDIQANGGMQHWTGSYSSFINNGTLTKSGGAGESFVDANPYNFGTIAIDNGTLRLGMNGTTGVSEGDFLIGPGTTLELQGSQTMLAPSSFSGAGGVSYSGGGSTVIQSNSYLVSGPLAVSGGTLEFSAAVTVAGDVTVSGGTLDATADIALSGTLQQTGGSMSGAGAVTVSGLFTWSAGTQAGSGETLASGGILLSGSNSKDLWTRTLTLNAASSWTGGAVRFRNAATMNNNVSFDIQTDQDMSHWTGAFSTFINNGSLVKSTGVDATLINAHFINQGSVSVSTGELGFGQTYLQVAPATLDAAISISGFDRYAVGSSATLGGTLNIVLQGGFEPDLGEEFEVMSCAPCNGPFNTVNGLAIGNGKKFEITYGAAAITLEVVTDP